mmetsp:Transcript_15017/g.50384  ORF Transcript_15017/g.50384 Transcript_15017/m.50384 type:complete len:275 (+) Transcript_15017:1288-2112(+)
MLAISELQSSLRLCVGRPSRRVRRRRVRVAHGERVPMHAPKEAVDDAESGECAVVEGVDEGRASGRAGCEDVADASAVCERGVQSQDAHRRPLRRRPCAALGVRLGALGDIDVALWAAEDEAGARVQSRPRPRQLCQFRGSSIHVRVLERVDDRQTPKVAQHAQRPRHHGHVDVRGPGELPGVAHAVDVWDDLLHCQIPLAVRRRAPALQAALAFCRAQRQQLPRPRKQHWNLPVPHGRRRFSRYGAVAEPRPAQAEDVCVVVQIIFAPALRPW